MHECTNHILGGGGGINCTNYYVNIAVYINFNMIRIDQPTLGDQYGNHTEMSPNCRRLQYVIVCLLCYEVKDKLYV